MTGQLPSKDVLPQGWITLGQAYNFLRARVLADGDYFILDHFDCKYINARIDMRTGKVLLSPGNGRALPPGPEWPCKCGWLNDATRTDCGACEAARP